jgi:hypothetical protein
VFANASKQTRIFVKLLRATSLAPAIQQDLAELTNATIHSAPREETISGRRAVVMDLAGHPPDVEDAPLAWRAIWIAGTDGVFAVISVGPPGEIEAARAQVDGIARTYRPVPPDRGPVERAVGCFNFYSYKYGVMVSRTVQLDGKGNASSSGVVEARTEVGSPENGHLGVVHGEAGYIADPEKGVYGVQGDTLSVQWNDASTTTYKIRWNGDRVGYLTQGSDAYVTCT